MKLQPLVTLWLLVPYILASAGFVAWQAWQLRKRYLKDKQTVPVRRLVRRAALLLLPGIIALGPSVQGGVSAPGVTNLDVIFAVDTTPSMGALDYNGAVQRMEGVKKDLEALSTALKGSHMEIITFDTQANVILPLTTDITAFSSAVSGLIPQTNSYSQGSSIDKPISLVTQELKNAANAYPEHFRLLFYLGDGEQTAQTTVKSFGDLSKYLTGGAVMGYGTAAGAQMVKYTGIETADSALPAGRITTVDAANNRLVPAISKMDANALQKIASQLKVTYAERNQGGPVDALYQASQAKLAVDKSQRVVHYLNLYWLVAIPFAGLLFWEWQAIIVLLLNLRERHKQDQTKQQGGQHA